MGQSPKGRRPARLDRQNCTRSRIKETNGREAVRRGPRAQGVRGAIRFPAAEVTEGRQPERTVAERPQHAAGAPEVGAGTAAVLTGMTTRYMAVSGPELTVTTTAVYPAGGVTVEITEVSPP